jgi:hypothetical protein
LDIRGNALFDGTVVFLKKVVASGDLDVRGTLTKAAGDFKIDHPLDPANKYLSHSFVESPDMKNVYDGVAVLDDAGEAVVRLPDWFEALNRDCRYQLTPLGGPARDLHVAEEVCDNQFKIAGGPPGMKVCWQVTGIRQDAYANAHRTVVEEEKAEGERGRYLHPELFGQPASVTVKGETKGARAKRRGASYRRTGAAGQGSHPKRGVRVVR